MKKTFFKKMSVTASALAATLLVASCGNSPAGNGTETAKDTTAPTTAPTTASTGDSTAGSDASSGEGDAYLNIALNSDIVSMDVHKTTNDYLVPMNVFDTLFTTVKNPDGSTTLVNSLADDYSISEDGLTYSITLKDGIVFSDGTPLTADDVKFTFERILTLPESAQTDYAIAIDGAQDMLDGKASELRGITVIDDTHLTITLAEPFAVFLAQLAAPSTSIMSRSITTNAGDDFGVVPEKTLGTGPYVVTSWDKGVGLTFEYNPHYWGTEPSVKKVTAKVMDSSSMDMAFQKGDLDILDCMMLDSAIVDSVYKTSYSDKIVSVDRLGMNYLMLNEDSEPLNDVNVRKAIQMAIDRKSILDSIYEGDGNLEDGIYPTGCLGYSKDNQGWLSYDPEGAKKLLADSGYPDGFEMEISLDSGNNDASKNTVQVIAQNLNDVGIKADVKTYDHASWLDLRNSGKMNSFLALWILDYNDPDNIIYTFFGSKSNSAIRSCNYSDEATIARVAAARAIVDPVERITEYGNLEKKLIQDDAAWVPLFSLKHLYVVSDRVESFTPHWAGWSDIYFTGVELK
ncbi:MAG: ABC transporter substrate-binding protein [Butyrivibrio sp.]|nr:ABC transporter substrate-binding protein [Butyrivibrio sp.]